MAAGKAFAKKHGTAGSFKPGAFKTSLFFRKTQKFSLKLTHCCKCPGLQGLSGKTWLVLNIGFEGISNLRSVQVFKCRSQRQPCSKQSYPSQLFCLLILHCNREDKLVCSGVPCPFNDWCKAMFQCFESEATDINLDILSRTIRSIPQLGKHIATHLSPPMLSVVRHPAFQ